MRSNDIIRKINYKHLYPRVNNNVNREHVHIIITFESGDTVELRAFTLKDLLGAFKDIVPQLEKELRFNKYVQQASEF